MKRLSLLLLIFASCATASPPTKPAVIEPAKTPVPTPSGFMPVEWDASSGKLTPVGEPITLNKPVCVLFAPKP